MTTGLAHSAWSAQSTDARLFGSWPRCGQTTPTFAPTGAASTTAMPRSARRGQPKSSTSCPHSAVLQLSDREMQVLLLIAEGLSYRAIGTQLYVSVNTVKNHARNSLQKSQLHRRWGDWPGPAS